MNETDITQLIANVAADLATADTKDRQTSQLGHTQRHNKPDGWKPFVKNVLDEDLFEPPQSWCTPKT